MKKIKHILIGFILGLTLCIGFPVFAEAFKIILNPFPVLVDGEVTEVEGYNINGFTFLKLADFKKAGLTVKFNETDKQIEITSTAAPSTQQNNNIGGTKAMIEYDAVTGLPVGAEYVENDKDGVSYKAIKYNGITFVSTSDLKRLFEIKATVLDVKTGIQNFAKDASTVGVDVNSALFIGSYVYYDVTLFDDLLK